MAGARTTLYATAAAIGVVAGLLSGLFGVGGGILIVPMLVLVAGLDQKLAHGTSLASVVPIAAAGVIGYLTDAKIDWPVAFCLVAGALGGAWVGTYFLHRLPERVVGFAFALLLLATALRLVVETSEAIGRSTLDVVDLVALVVGGAVTGLLAGLLGVGGGVVMVPFMVVGFGMPAVLAKGTSLVVILPISIVGTWRNRANRNADLQVAGVVGAAGVLSALVGSQISLRMSEQTSNWMFAVLLAIVAIRMLIRLVQGRRG